jgi:Ni,Fe-hydrogenase III large subunit
MHDLRIPVGPQHPAWVEPLHLSLKVDGEDVVDADIQLGYVHRGIEKALETRTWAKSVYLSGRTCGICSQSHTSCFSQGIEQLLGVQVPERGSYVRTMFNELERLHSHMLLVAVSGHVIGFETAFHYVWRDRETVLGLFEMLAGKRVQQDVNAIGGVRWDISAEHAKAVSEGLDKVKGRVEHYLRTYAKDVSIRKRLKGRGVLTAGQVKEYGLVGPVARASGVRLDLRENGYMAYPDLHFHPITGTAGDNLERMVLRLRECLESIRLIQDALTMLPAGDVRVRMPPRLQVEPGRETVSRIEAPRGELLYYVKSAGDRPERVKIRTPTYANFAAARELVVGHQVADVPINIVTLDPCMACCDRMTITNASTGQSREFSHHEVEGWGDGRGMWG